MNSKPMTPAVLLTALLILTAWLAPGCGGGPNMTVYQWTLEYPPPRTAEAAPLPAVLKLARFTANQAYMDADMIYSQDALQRKSYVYNRWRVSPADLVGDILLRDFRRARIFRAVFSHRQRGKARFRLEGAVQRFLEDDQGPRRLAVLRVNLTLLDYKYKDILKRVVFQKDYQAQAAMPTKNAAGLAQAMSRAMREISGKILADVRREAARALAAED